MNEMKMTQTTILKCKVQKQLCATLSVGWLLKRGREEDGDLQSSTQPPQSVVLLLMLRV